MDKLPTTIEELAAMLYKHMASKEDIKTVQEDLAVSRSEMKAWFDWIETLLLAKQEQRFNDLEACIKELEDAFAV